MMLEGKCDVGQTITQQPGSSWAPNKKWIQFSYVSRSIFTAEYGWSATPHAHMIQEARSPTPRLSQIPFKFAMPVAAESPNSRLLCLPNEVFSSFSLCYCQLSTLITGRVVFETLTLGPKSVLPDLVPTPLVAESPNRFRRTNGGALLIGQALPDLRILKMKPKIRTVEEEKGGLQRAHSALRAPRLGNIGALVSGICRIYSRR
jgi:hypothetical protein